MRIRCISLCVSRIIGVWLLHMIMIVMESYSLVAILAQWIASMMGLWYGECTIPTPIQFKDFATMDEPKIMSPWCGKLYCSRSSTIV